MYIEASEPVKSGEKARLQTEILQASSASVCLSFWYHMYGDTMGQLKVIVHKDGQSSELWSNNGKIKENVEVKQKLTFFYSKSINTFDTYFIQMAMYLIGVKPTLRLL